MHEVQLKFIFGKPTRICHDPIPTHRFRSVFQLQTQMVSKFIEIFCVLIYWLRKFKTTQIRVWDSIMVQVITV